MNKLKQEEQYFPFFSKASGLPQWPTHPSIKQLLVAFYSKIQKMWCVTANCFYLWPNTRRRGAMPTMCRMASWYGIQLREGAIVTLFHSRLCKIIFFAKLEN